MNQSVVLNWTRVSQVNWKEAEDKNLNHHTGHETESILLPKVAYELWRFWLFTSSSSGCAKILQNKRQVSTLGEDSWGQRREGTPNRGGGAWRREEGSADWPRPRPDRPRNPYSWGSSVGAQGRRSRTGSWPPERGRFTPCSPSKMCPGESSGTNRGLEDHPQHSNSSLDEKPKFLMNWTMSEILTPTQTCGEGLTQKNVEAGSTALLSELKRAACTLKQVVRCYITDAKLGKEENCNI